jgi:hypothetical protein
MQEFADLDAYLAASSGDEDLAFLPVPIVADYLGISSPAVTARLKSGSLEEVRIGKQRFVSRRSLVALREADQDMIQRTEAFLMDLAAKGEARVFYDPVMSNVGLRWQVPAHRDKIGWVLGAVSERSYENHGVLLSVLVHKKTPGDTLPSGGFFTLAEHLGFDTEDWHSLVARETRKVLRKFGRSKAA